MYLKEKKNNKRSKTGFEKYLLYLKENTFEITSVPNRKWVEEKTSIPKIKKD